MTFNLVPAEKSCQKVNYEGSNSHQSIDMANVKVFADKQTDKPTNGWAKNYMYCETKNSHQSIDIANVKVFADKQTDKLTNGRAKNYMYCETRNFRQALIFVDFVGKAIHEFKFTTNVFSRSLICD